MANGFQGPPAADFYGMLSGLGDTIQANRTAQAKRDAFALATTPGPDGQIDYGRAILGLAQVDPQAAALFAQRQNHADTLKQQAIENQHWATTNSRAAAAESRAAADYENTPDQFAKNPKFGQPGEPQYIDQYELAKSAAEAGSQKPIPYETLGGTKFLIPQRGGGYSNVDPRTIGAGAPVPSSPRMVGDAEGVASGLYDPPNAPGQRPPVQVADAQPSNFASRFQGQPGASQPSASPPDLTAVDPKTGRREAWLNSQSPDVQAYIKKIADYEIDPRTTSIKGGHREQVLSAVAQYDPTYNQNDFGARAKAIRDFGTGQQGNIVRSFDVAIDHLDTLQRAADAMQNGNTRLINELRNKWREQTGSDLPTNFKALVPIVSGEIAKAVVGSQNALADREELRAGLKTSSSPDQLSGVITGYKALMAGQLKGLRKQYEETTGKKNFDSRVRESTRKAILSDDGGKADVTIDGYRIKEN